LTITDTIADPPSRHPTMGTLRLRLKPAHSSCGFVQGAWWPRSTELGSELPSLLAALSLRGGSIDSVLYHENDWSPAPPSIKHQGDQVIVSAHQEWPNAISLFGTRSEDSTCWWYPHTPNPLTHAYNVVTAAACITDASTPDQLLGIPRRADERPFLPIAIERWESDGGALPHTPRSQPQTQDAMRRSAGRAPILA